MLKKNTLANFILRNVIAFSIVFVVLGVVILHMMNSSAYSETDSELKDISWSDQLVASEVERAAIKNANEYFAQDPYDRDETGRSDDRFTSQIILWSADGTILNPYSLGNRFDVMSQFKPDAKLGVITEHAVREGADIYVSPTDGIRLKEKVHSGSARTSYFRSVTIPYPTDADPFAASLGLSKVQVIINVDQIKHAQSSFRTALVVCMIFFGALAALLSVGLAFLNMQPILAAYKKQQEFVSNASHEIRTPLAILQNQLEGLFKKPTATIMDEADKIGIALGEVRRLDKLTGDLLTVSRVDDGRLKLETTLVDPEIALGDMLSNYAELADSQEREFSFDVAAGALHTDLNYLKQILTILIDNAMKYSSDGDSVSVEGGLAGRFYSFKVADTGVGISDKDKKRIFDRFYRVDTSHSGNGNGIGLSIAAELSKVLGYKLDVYDNKPKGVVFEIRVPI
ncbi:MAG: HAMP domain-containing histidine kinase [Lactobacillales bacterium]|jgi:two-component system sensor histidine kinase CiaH|nr:HAMP domain-containing histidine kinase [Lactobacillales bacterium]